MMKPVATSKVFSEVALAKDRWEELSQDQRQEKVMELQSLWFRHIEDVRGDYVATSARYEQMARLNFRMGWGLILLSTGVTIINVLIAAGLEWFWLTTTGAIFAVLVSTYTAYMHYLASPDKLNSLLERYSSLFTLTRSSELDFEATVVRDHPSHENYLSLLQAIRRLDNAVDAARRQSTSRRSTQHGHSGDIASSAGPSTSRQ